MPLLAKGKVAVISLWAPVALGAALCAPAHGADVYLGVGTGIRHTEGLAFQVAASVYQGIEGHYSTWNETERGHAVGLGYRFDNGSPVSVVLGIAYVARVTENLLHNADAYVEVRIGPFGDFSCQVSHYSTVGDDRGENLLLCGVQWK